ncbi:DUF2752 domain-containing protein [Polyangium jinanense]|uniref:DUF2752 domain-containing protein n=1 Tax=Polyangium jinanense TaxID=2829994 RepID=A0A9X4AP04_9BACT|nr:DUF2752 domain-containing protein [Polyangium jinanense]MDC3953402.1 DUF2752 domain-containing protein [Polyangium jinanense]MDC3979478.1 DUF2752 domain-containing protein [Polyangium jinanense]
MRESAAKRLRFALPALSIAFLLALVPQTTCILRLTLGLPCPACGLTRAALALLRLDLATATAFHPLALPLAFVAIATVFAARFLDDAAWKRFGRDVSGGSGVAIVIVWALRFLGLFGGPVP